MVSVSLMVIKIQPSASHAECFAEAGQDRFQQFIAGLRQGKPVGKLQPLRPVIILALVEILVEKDLYPALDRFRKENDEEKKPGYNQALSERRATAVKDYLVDQHVIDPGTITAKGLGAENLIAKEKTPDGKDDSDNVEIERWGDPPAFDFEPQTHEALGVRLGGTGPKASLW